MKKLARIFLVLAVVVLLSGCMLTVDEMYRVPKRSDAYHALQSAVDEAMLGMSYCAPSSGENRQTIQIADLDGDGTSEYVLFAKSTEEKPLRIMVFRNQNGSFVHVDTVECNGTAFDRVEYVDMDGQPGVEIVIGRQLSDQVLRSASVYKFHNNELTQLVGVNYTKLMTVDLDGDNIWELFLLRPGQTDADVGIAELYRVRDGVMERYNEAAMSQPAEKIKRIIVGKLDGGKPAVYVASAVDENSLVTDVYSVYEGKLVNVALLHKTGTDVKTMRNFYVYADDIDNDYVIELPSLIPMKPMTAGDSIDSHQLIRWYAMSPEGEEVDKMYTYHNFVDGWYLQLDSAWSNRLFVEMADNAYVFYLWDESYKTSEKVFTIYAITGQNREEQGSVEGKFIIHKTESVVYAGRMERNAGDYELTSELVIDHFRLIQQEWKTGET